MTFLSPETPFFFIDIYENTLFNKVTLVYFVIVINYQKNIDIEKDNMSSLVTLLNNVSEGINIIVGISFFVLGIIGNSLSILIFCPLLKTKVFSASPGRLYLLTISIANLIFVVYLLLTRILISGFFIPVTNTNNFMCKSRFYIGQICMYTSLFCTCLATIDQYLTSNRSVKLRQLSRLSLTKMIIIISTLIWCLINIPILLLYNVYPKGNSLSTVCTVYSSSWTFYYTYFQSLIFLCVIPLTIFLIFGILTRHNLRTVRQLDQSISHQMTRMILLQSMTMAISLFIATVQIIYQTVTINISKDSLRLAQENLFNTIANLLTYVNYIAPFYIYLYSSKSLRKNLKNILMNREKNPSIETKTHLTQNQTINTINIKKIHPITKVDN